MQNRGFRLRVTTVCHPFFLPPHPKGAFNAYGLSLKVESRQVDATAFRSKKAFGNGAPMLSSRVLPFRQKAALRVSPPARFAETRFDEPIRGVKPCAVPATDILESGPTSFAASSLGGGAHHTAHGELHPRRLVGEPLEDSIHVGLGCPASIHLNAHEQRQRPLRICRGSRFGPRRRGLARRNGAELHVGRHGACLRLDNRLAGRHPL